ncbi:tudor domain-containing protein 5-like [Toxorhynchites rutilus septentrionalis]|uniref:tudor domain-containing protein 5-like n=1 Tax=Toxorhynchites rutilus septentrionalis TaxID=329112 RepID=UPI00247AC23E|nr:tudor domain-containing protein 5-like [Toxorhynchites rutilus septentrionalis]
MEEYTLEEIKQIIRSIAISGTSNYLSTQELARDFKKMEGFELPYRRLGFLSVDQFLHTLTDTVKVKGYGSSALVEPVVTQSNQHIRTLVQNSKKQKTRPKQRYNNSSYGNNNNRMNKGYSSYCTNHHGNQNSNAPRKIQNEEYCYLETVDHGNESDSSDSMPKFNMTEDKKLEQVARPLQNQINGYCNNSYSVNGEYSSYDANRNNPLNSDAPKKVQNGEYNILEITTSDGNEAEHATSMPKFNITGAKKKEQVANSAQEQKNYPQRTRHNDAIPNDVALLLINSLEIPKEAMILGDKVDDATFPETIAPKQSMKIFVTEVHNPNRLWFHIGENTEKIDDLMNEIEVFYTQLHKEEWRIKAANAVVGLFCAAKYNGLWHRAKIVEAYLQTKVKVFYIDYGTVSEVELKDIKFLAKCFAQLPAQAMRASLAYVKPAAHRWTRNASLSLLALVYEKLLYAYIVDVDRKDNVIDVVLIDTSGTQDIIVNQQLFVKGHATWEDDMPYKEKTVESYRDRSKTYCELYPRFDELECGIYPSFREIGIYRAEGFNFPRYYMQSLREDSEFLQYILTTTFTIPSGPIVPTDVATEVDSEEEQYQCSRDKNEQNECSSAHDVGDTSVESSELGEASQNPFRNQQEDVPGTKIMRRTEIFSELWDLDDMTTEIKNLNEIASNNPFNDIYEQNVLETETNERLL